MKMNIMYILHESGEQFNGASRSVLTLIRAFTEEGNKIYVVVPEKKGRLVEQLLLLHNIEIVEAHFYRWKVRRKKPIKSILCFWKYKLFEKNINKIAARKLSSFAKHNKIDIIHSNSSVINLGGLIHKYTKIPHIWHIREFGEEDFNMYPLDSEKDFYKFIYQNSDEIICISNAIKEKMCKHIPDDKIRVVYNGIKVPDYIKKTDFGNKVLISGFISKNKGQWIAIEAVNILKKKGINIELNIAGTGDISQLKSIYKPDPDYIHFLGFVDDMTALRNSIDIEVMCSVSEAFGRTMIEAMASGVLIIAADGGATPEIIRENENGFLFHINDPISLANKLEMIVRYNTEIKQCIRYTAYQDVKKRFSEEIYVNKVREIYYKSLKIQE